MGRGKNLDTLRELNVPVLREVVREGELMMAAQFAAASASDQRAMTWAGFVITVATGSIGAAATLAINGTQLPLAVIAAALGALMCRAAFLAISCVRPRKFALPGNRPENWLPADWEFGRGHSLSQALIEQARCLNDQIDDNATWAESTARTLAQSMDQAIIAVVIAAVYVCGYIAYQLLL